MEIILKSKRLRFVRFTKDKVNKTYKNWMNDNEITEFILKSNINKISSLKNFVESMQNSKNFFFQIIDQKSNKHIGNVRIGPLSFKEKSSGYGIMIGDKNFHNKGYGKEVTSFATNFLFVFLNFRKIEFDCYIANIPAMKLYEKLDFKKKYKSKKIKTFYKVNDKL